ncbi:NLR family CARD domain-containing protein 4-like isoform X2 [Antedon mediterranea]
MNNSVCVFNSTVDNINVNIRSRSTDPSSNTPIKIHVGEGGHVQHFNTTTVIQPDEPQLLTEQELIRCRNQLRQYYKSNCKIRLLPWMTRDPRNRLEMKNLFISLYLICEVPNAIEVSVQVQHYKEVLPSSSPYRALIRGKAGAGKTTLLEKLALDWAEEKLPHTHNEIPLLFLIRMKSVVKGDTLINAIFKQRLLGIEIERMFKTKLSNYIDNNSDKVIILVDAVDEYGGEYGTDEPGEIENIIRNEYLSEACVIATTRPWRAFQIIDKSPDVYIGQNYEVKGYTQVQVKEYVEQFFGSKVEMANTLLNQMNMTGISTGIATIPVMCMLICILYRDHKAVLPDTISDLYELLYEYLMQCNRKDNLEQVSERDKVETVDKLAKLAFYGLRNKQMCFEEGEYIDANVLRNACKMGLLLQINLTTESEDQTSFPAGLSSLPLIKNYYEFFHKTFQEWFAARYLASKEINSLNQICEQTIPDIQTCLDFELPLRFLSGSKVPVVSEVPTKCLLRIVQNTQDLSDFNDNKLDLPKTKEFQEFLELLVKCNMESKSKGRFNHLLNDVFEKCNAHFTNATSMTLHALAYMLKFGGALNGCPHCGKPSSDFCPHQLRILDFKIGCYSADTNSDIDILWGEFEAVGKQYYKRCQLLSNEPEEKLQAIFEQVKNMLPQGIPHLSLARTLAFSKLCKFMETWKGDYIFMEKVIQNIPFTRITNFTINGVNLSNNCELLCKNLTTMTSLRKVDLGCTSLEVQHCSFIGKMLGSLHELRTLNLPKNKLQEIGEIVEQLHCVPNLTRLDLETTHLTSNSMSLLGKNLK